MHIPDGFLDAKTSLATSALAITGLAVALRHARLTLPPRKVPLLGLSAAFIFAAQMVNFPVAGGTSGHLMGGTLAAALLGPSATIIVLSTVLLLQCFAFADGGITALGANLFNMGIIGGVGGWMVYALLTRFLTDLKGRIVAAVVAGWMSTLLASIVCAGELAISGTAPWSLTFPAMAGVHALIGIGEGVITALVLSAVASARPELVLQTAALPQTSEAGRGWLRPVMVYGFCAALGIGLFVAPFASPHPDGLEKTAQALGFDAKARTNAAPLSDYQVPGIARPALATAIAGAMGTLAVFGIGLLVARRLVPRPQRVLPPDVVR